MRDLLKSLSGQRIEFTATIDKRGCDRVSIDKGYIKHTRCLINVKVNNKIVSDHLWIDANSVKGFIKGDIVKFTAIVTTYYKRVNNIRVKDYNISKIENAEKFEGECYEYRTMHNCKTIQM